MDFPGGPVVKNPPANAENTGLISGPGRFHMPQGNQAHAPQLLSPCATTTEARTPRACAAGEATTMRSPRATTRKPACCNKDTAQPKNNDK